MQISSVSLLFLQSPLHILSSLICEFNFFFAGCPIILPRENESVLLGASILGAVAAKKFSGVRDAMKSLNAAGKACDKPSYFKEKKESASILYLYLYC
jgi:ribulose kinase